MQKLEDDFPSEPQDDSLSSELSAIPTPSLEQENPRPKPTVSTPENETLAHLELFKKKRRFLMIYSTTILVFLSFLIVLHTFIFLMTINLTKKALFLVSICKHCLVFWILFKGMGVIRELLPIPRKVTMCFNRFWWIPTIYGMAASIRIAIFCKENDLLISTPEFLCVDFGALAILTALWGFGYLHFNSYHRIYMKNWEEFEKLKQESPGLFIF